MTRSTAFDLLADLRQRGVELGVEDGQLRFRPSADVSPELRTRLAAHRSELIALMGADASEPGDGERPSVERCRTCRGLDFVRPSSGGAWRCARCRPYDLSACEFESWPRIALAAPFEAQANASCYACRATARWRLRSEGPWVCGRCHPPLVATESIEMDGEDAR